MFTFHKPKVFRSANGCCICGAKSSSSRFTDSKRYEACFDRCFDLDGVRREGEICNACVLLVKRYMKLPSGTLKHWNHVVDARSGPGIKSLVRSKNKGLNGNLNGNKQNNNNNNEYSDSQDLTPEKPIHKRKHVYRSKTGNMRINNQSGNNNITSLSTIRHPKKQPVSSIRRLQATEYIAAQVETPISSLTMDERYRRRRQGAGEFVDSALWKKHKICCGFIFIGPNSELAVDHRYLRRCEACKILKEPAVPSTITSAVHTFGNKTMRFCEFIADSPLSQRTEEIPMDMITAGDESTEECDSLSEGQSASSLYSSQSEDSIRATKLAFDVESEVRGASTEMLHSPEYAVDADEGFFDKQLGSPTSTSSGASTPPPVPHILSPHPSNVIQNASPPLIRGGTTT